MKRPFSQFGSGVAENSGSSTAGADSGPISKPLHDELITNGISESFGSMQGRWW